ncbi:MAG TPA: GntR family transcriptional regulator, partial [Clostridiales bacterium]|nr:GntR family transcriptional regulator [Clostridiales bacterium]
MKIRPLKKTLLSDQIIDEIKESILSGNLKPGDKLPS